MIDFAREEMIICAAAERSVGPRDAHVPESVSPALFHGENQLSKDKSSAVHSRTFEAESGQTPRRQEEKRSYSSSLAQSSPRTDQLSVVRNSHTTAAQNSKLCVSRDEGYLISRTDQLSVVRHSHATAAQNSKLCVSRDEGYLISRTDQLSVVRNSHTTAAQNSKLFVSRDEGYPFSRTD